MGLATCHWLLVACLLSALRLAAGAWCGKEGCYQVLGYVSSSLVLINFTVHALSIAARPCSATQKSVACSQELLSTELV